MKPKENSGTKITIKIIKDSSQVLLAKFLREEERFEKNFSRMYLRMKFWSNLFSKVRKYPAEFGKVFLHFLWRAGVAFVLLVMIYSVSPLALSAPQSVSVTFKNEWERGTLTNATTFGTRAAEDAIQLKPSGTWTARTWAPPPDAISFGHSSAMVGDYLYAFRGYSDKNFWRYSISENKWEDLPDLPVPAHSGADIAYDGNGNLYMIFGGYSRKFFKYNIENKNFTELDDLLDTPHAGAAIETDGTDMYVVRGNGTTDFWKYDVSEAGNDGAWSNLAPVSGSVSAGGDLVNGQNGYLYLVRGGGQLNFYRYNLTTRQWQTDIASLPSGQTMSGEQRGVYWNGYLYFLRSGGTTGFLRYKISNPGGNVWENMTNDVTPLATNYASLVLNVAEDNIYAIRGNGSFDFWKFDPDAAEGLRWIGPRQVNDGTNGTIGTGGDLIWNGSNTIYAIRGGNTNNFYTYNISANTWAAGTVLPWNTNNDIKGTYYSGNAYYPRSGSTSVYYSNGGAWSTVTPTLQANAGEGAGLAYNSGDNRIYCLRGAGTQTLYYVSTGNLGVGGTWPSAANISVSDGGTTVNYYPNVGARMVSNNTNLFIMPGDGETAFIRYNTGTNNDSSPHSHRFGGFAFSLRLFKNDAARAK